MAAIAIQPVRKTTSTSAGTTTITTDYTVPASKRWLFDIIELAFGTAAAGNTVDIQFGQGGSGYVNIWPQISNFTNLTVDLASRFPRTCEGEAADVIRIIHTRGTSSTCVSTVYIIERSI